MRLCRCLEKLGKILNKEGNIRPSISEVIKFPHLFPTGSCISQGFNTV